MARKRKTDLEADGAVAVAELPMALPAEGPTEPQPEPRQEAPPPAAEPEKQKPLVSYRISSDRTTSISLALWCNQMTNTQTGEAYEQLSVTVQRRYRTDQGWSGGGAWRVHDLPVLMFLLQKAHAFALDRRTEDSSLPF